MMTVQVSMANVFETPDLGALLMITINKIYFYFFIEFLK